ncbi:MAG: lamin tail domain-containing protein, partial [Candidatus Latescibacterota bacterium]
MSKIIYAMMIAVSAMIFSFSSVAANPVAPGGITEFSVDPDFIEIHLQYWSSREFQKPFIVDGKIVTVDPNYDPFLGGEYVVYDSTNTSGFDLKPEGGFIKIPGVGDTLRYGPGQLCPSPPPGESVTTNGEYPYKLYPYLWNIDPTPTPRALNDAPDPRYGSGTVFINEVFPGDESNSAFIELYNNADSGVNIGGFSLINCLRYKIPAETMIPGHGFFVLNKKDFPEGFALSVSGGTIFLQNSNFELIDQMGWPGGLETGISLNRIPDGFASVFQGYTYANSIDFREGNASPGQPNTG